METPLEVIIEFSLNSDDYELLDDFEEHLERAVTFHGIGTYEGYELDSEHGSRGEFYMTTTYGDLLYKTIRPLLLDAGFLKEIRIKLQSSADGGTHLIKEYEL